jgi:hypothetical protein
MKDNFSTFDIVKILGINKNTLQSAIAGRYIEPDIQKPLKEQGHRAKFGKKGLRQIVLFFALLSYGISREDATKEIKSINWQHFEHEISKLPKSKLRMTYHKFYTKQYRPTDLFGYIAIDIEGIIELVDEIIKKY